MDEEDKDEANPEPDAEADPNAMDVDQSGPPAGDEQPTEGLDSLQQDPDAMDTS